MNLDLPIDLAKEYKSKSQIARVVTEAWVISNITCPNCGSSLRKYPANEKSKDVFCPSCGNDFQIKSSKNKFSKRITGAEYNTTLHSVKIGENPSFMLLHYDENSMRVVDFMLIHNSFITSEIIIPRKPLSKKARRAGWQGCLIEIDKIPSIAKIFVIKDGIVYNWNNIVNKWKISSNVRQFSVQNRGWVSIILSFIDRLPDTFTLSQLYNFENELKTLYPKNHNIRAKIRQQLQIIRDLGLIKFVERGKYQKIRIRYS